MGFLVSILSHLYRLAELYTVLLAWVAIPLGYYAVYLFFNNHYGMFSPQRAEEQDRGTDR